MVVITTVLAFILCILVNRHFFGVTTSRMLVMLPWTIPPAIYALVWKFIYNGHFGLLNRLLMQLKIINTSVFWLGSPNTALASVIWVGVLNSIPFTSLVLLGGFQSIPRELYEAAAIDGSSAWQDFWYITLPSLRYMLMVVTLFNVIYIFRSFSMVWVLTEGGPLHHTEIIATYLYKTAFKALNFGLASSLAVIAFIILMLFVLVYTNLLKEEHEEI